MTSSDSLAPTASAAEMSALRLTEWTSCGGCAAKWGASLLTQLVRDVPAGSDPDLLVGLAPFDDAAIYRLTDELAMVSTTDFFPPLVDDPADFGAIAAANACSDVFAMGGRVVVAVNIAAFPEHMPHDAIAAIFDAAAATVAAAGGTVAGGHTIRNPEPVFGLAVQGLVHPDRVFRKGGARSGDVLVLGKPLGIGVLSAALKKGLLDARGYEQMLSVTTQLNRVGCTLATLAGVHAMTDVTGFGLAGHLLEVCRGSGIGADVDFAALPVLTSAQPLFERGLGPGAIERNWASCSAEVEIGTGLPAWAWRLLCDPQTSGGLLVSCAPAAVVEVLSAFADEGFTHAAQIGRVRAGDRNPRLRLT